MLKGTADVKSALADTPTTGLLKAFIAVAETESISALLSEFLSTSLCPSALFRLRTRSYVALSSVIWASFAVSADVVRCRYNAF